MPPTGGTEESMLLQQEQMLAYHNQQLRLRQQQGLISSTHVTEAYHKEQHELHHQRSPRRSDSISSIPVTVASDGLSISDHVPEHVIREQQEILDQAKQRGQGAATTPPRNRSSSSCNSSTAATAGRVRPRREIEHQQQQQQQQQQQRTSASGYLLPHYLREEGGENLAQSDSTDHHGNLSYQDSMEDSVASIPDLALSGSAATPPRSPMYAASSSSSSRTTTAWDDTQAKRQVQLPQVTAERQRRRSGRNHNTIVPHAPPTDTIEDSQEEIDVDNIDDVLVERVPSANPLGKTKNPTMGIVGVFNIVDPLPQSDSSAAQLTPPPPQAVRDQPPPATPVPKEIQQDMSASEWDQSTVTQSISAFTPRTPTVMVHATLSCEPPIPDTITPRPSISNGGTGGNENTADQPPPTEQLSTKSYVLGGTLFFFAMFAIWLALAFTSPAFAFFGLYEEKAKPPTIAPTAVPTVQVPTNKPTPAPTTTPTPIVLDLPDYTLQAVRDYPVTAYQEGSPQARAYQWLLEDMAFTNRTQARLFQRFALATFYFATNFGETGEGSLYDGDPNINDAWRGSLGWLDHSMDECDWFTNLNPPDTVCDPETGEYKALVLNRNNLRGFIPPELSLITSLRYLDLGTDNRLDYAPYNNDCLPTHLGLLTNLEYLNLLQVQACGGIPSEIGMLSNLTAIELDRAFKTTDEHQWELQRKIPTEIGLLTKLETLSLRGNKLQGTLPSELAKPLVSTLWKLEVSQNDLNGTIPEEFDVAMEIRKRRQGDQVTQGAKSLAANFEGNSLTGRIPSELCSLLQRLTFDCDEEGMNGVCGCGLPRTTPCDCAATAAASAASTTTPLEVVEEEQSP